MVAKAAAKLAQSQEDELDGDKNSDGEEDEYGDGSVDGDGDAPDSEKKPGGYPGGEDEWEEIFACPLSIRFTQEKIHPFFYRRGPIVNVVPKIRPVERDDVVDLVPPFTPIHCLRQGETLWSLDNRRLYALQLAAMDQWPRRCRVRLLSRERLPRHKFKTQYRKFNTTSQGHSIEVSTRYQQFDTWSWYERAIELEWYALSQRLGMMLSIFEAAPVVGALLFRSGLTGFTSRLPLFIGFAMAFSVDFIRQKVPYFERKLCELQVYAIMDGETVQMTSWWKGRGEGSEQISGCTTAQLAATMAIALVLLLPYIIGISRDKLRSSLFSCWLGVAFMLVVQLVPTFWSMRSKRRRAEESTAGLHGGIQRRLGEAAENSTRRGKASKTEETTTCQGGECDVDAVSGSEEKEVEEDET